MKKEESRNIPNDTANTKELQYDELNRIIIHDPTLIPESMTEEEAHAFWQTHAMSEKLLDDNFCIDEQLPLPKRQLSTKPINIRMETDLLKRLQSLAELKKVPYQTLLKQFVSERIYEEEIRENIIKK